MPPRRRASRTASGSTSTSLFRNQDEAPARTVSDEFLEDVGNAIPGFDLDAWKQARESPAVTDRVEADAVLAADLRLRVEGRRWS